MLQGQQWIFSKSFRYLAELACLGKQIGHALARMEPRSGHEEIRQLMPCIGNHRSVHRYTPRCVASLSPALPARIADSILLHIRALKCVKHRRRFHLALYAIAHT